MISTAKCLGAGAASTSDPVPVCFSVSEPQPCSKGLLLQLDCFVMVLLAAYCFTGYNRMGEI